MSKAKHVIVFRALQLHLLNSLTIWKNASASIHLVLTEYMLVTMAQNGKDFENIMLILYEFQICLVFQNVAISFAVSAYN